MVKKKKVSLFRGLLEDNRDSEWNFATCFTYVFTILELAAVKLWPLVRPVYLVLYRRIEDGYWLVLLSPWLLVSWVAASAWLVILCIVPAAVAIVTLPAAALYGAAFELPSDFINKPKKRSSLMLSGEVQTALIVSYVVVFVTTIATVVYTACP